MRFVVATSFFARLRGLLGTKTSWSDGGTALIIPRCSSVHTFGMGYALDIAFIDKQGIVLRAERNVRPGCLLSCRKAGAVLERPHSADIPWFSPGEALQICSSLQE